MGFRLRLRLGLRFAHCSAPVRDWRQGWLAWAETAQSVTGLELGEHDAGSEKGHSGSSGRGGEEQVQALGLVLEVEGFDDGFAQGATGGFAFGGDQGLEACVEGRACPEVPPESVEGPSRRDEFKADSGDVACC